MISFSSTVSISQEEFDLASKVLHQNHCCQVPERFVCRLKKKNSAKSKKILHFLKLLFLSIQ
jgi:hypothetical protein